MRHSTISVCWLNNNKILETYDLESSDINKNLYGVLRFWVWLIRVYIDVAFENTKTWGKGIWVLGYHLATHISTQGKMKLTLSKARMMSTENKDILELIKTELTLIIFGTLI